MCVFFSKISADQRGFSPQQTSIGAIVLTSRMSMQGMQRLASVAVGASAATVFSTQGTLIVPSWLKARHALIRAFNKVKQPGHELRCTVLFSIEQQSYNPQSGFTCTSTAPRVTTPNPPASRRGPPPGSERECCLGNEGGIAEAVVAAHVVGLNRTVYRVHEHGVDLHLDATMTCDVAHEADFGGNRAPHL